MVSDAGGESCGGKDATAQEDPLSAVCLSRHRAAHDATLPMKLRFSAQRGGLIKPSPAHAVRDMGKGDRARSAWWKRRERLNNFCLLFLRKYGRVKASHKLNINTQDALGKSASRLTIPVWNVSLCDSK